MRFRNIPNLLLKFPKSFIVRNVLQRTSFSEEDGIWRAKRGKFEWYIPSNDWNQAQWVSNFMHGHERYLDYLREGDIVIEVGAATGEYTIPAAIKVGNTGKMFAFEAMPLIYRCLQKNLELKCITNVVVVNKAVSDKSNRHLQLSFSNGTIAEASFHRDSLSQKLTVDTVSLDDYMDSIELEKVDVLKLTVNGHEPEILKGAKNLLSSVRGIIFQSARCQQAISFLEESGYSVKKSFDVGAREEKVILMERTRNH